MRNVVVFGALVALSACSSAPPEPVPRQLGSDSFTVTASRDEGSSQAGEVSLAAAARFCRDRQRRLVVMRVASSENAMSGVAPSSTVDFRCAG